ncbi:hypothetical protein OBBRIDRAFT_430183 [Obba rivulosa]|uniref:F-box domain-containing protein n=1 Tax=Obba rivulosa TaxID=1052685 RepID=A0A8E2AX62_9APHY|nr:hypothetical protein OBBRIDRAFT_430183 [Obba rivulosa]
MFWSADVALTCITTVYVVKSWVGKGPSANGTPVASRVLFRAVGAVVCGLLSDHVGHKQFISGYLVLLPPCAIYAVADMTRAQFVGIYVAPAFCSILCGFCWHLAFTANVPSGLTKYSRLLPAAAAWLAEAVVGVIIFKFIPEIVLSHPTSKRLPDGEHSYPRPSRLVLESVFGLTWGTGWRLVAYILLKTLSLLDEFRGPIFKLFQLSFAASNIIGAVMLTKCIPIGSSSWRTLSWIGMGVAITTATGRTLLSKARVGRVKTIVCTRYWARMSRKTRWRLREIAEMLERQWDLFINTVLSMNELADGGEASSRSDLDDAMKRWILEYLPSWRSNSRILLQPGHLPLEIWDMILEFVDEQQTLEACGLTCKVLAARVRKMQMDALKIRCSTSGVEMRQLVRGVLHHPSFGFFLQEIVVPASLMTRFFYEFAGKLPALRTIELFRDDHMMPPFRPPLLQAARRFTNLQYIRVFDLKFWSFRDLARLICAFPKLRHLTLKSVTWQRGEGLNLADEPFAKTLALQEIHLFEPGNLEKYDKLLTAPKLSQSMMRLGISDLPHVSCVVEFDSAQLTSESARHAHSESILPRTASVHVKGRLQPRNAQWFQGCIKLLNDLSVRPGDSCWRAVDVKLSDLSDDVVEMFRVGSFPELRMQEHRTIIVGRSEFPDMK